MKKPIATLAIALFCANILNAQTEVTEFRPGSTIDGVTYFLPQTRLHLTIEATRTTITPGEYAPYAEHFLRIGDAEQKQREQWELKSITAVPYGVADPNRAYSIRLKQRTSAPLATLTADGCLLSINAETDQPGPLSQPSATTLPSTQLNANDYKTPEILAATNPYKAAELTAAEIYDIRENRSLLNKGQADFMPKDGEQLKLMLQNLTTTEEALLQLFRGTSSTTVYRYTIDYTPSDFSGNKQVLFRFSPLYGLTSADDMSGEPYYVTLTDEKTLPVEEINPKATKKPADDIRYCVASDASINITDPNGNSIYKTTLPFAQIGRIEHLGGDLFNKKYSTRVFLNPTTGGLLRIEADPVK